MKNTDLKIVITSKLSKTQQILLYQEDVQLNVKNFKVAAWEKQLISPGSIFSTVLPLEIEFGAATALGKGNLKTKLLQMEYNTSWDIFNNGGALDVRESAEANPDSDTIEIHNKDSVTRHAIVYKDKKPLFACEVRPDYKVNFAIFPRLYIALCDMEISGDFFEAALLSRVPLRINYEGQSQVNIELQEDFSSGKVNIAYSFS